MKAEPTACRQRQEYLEVASLLFQCQENHRASNSTETNQICLVDAMWFMLVQKENIYCKCRRKKKKKIIWLSRMCLPIICWWLRGWLWWLWW